MSDIVERLRALEAWIRQPTGEPYNMNTDLFDDAADEITRLRAEIEDYKRWAAQVTVEANEEVSRLRAENERLREWNHEIALNARKFAAKNERLRIENIQMQAALGYAIMAEDERHILPTNPYKCGTCDASSYLRAENERLRAALEPFVCVCDGETICIGECMHRNARAALDFQPAPGKEGK